MCRENNSAQDRLSPIAYELLAYLAEHPEAQDTLVGVMRWWLLERQTRYWQPQVQAALEQLQAEDLVVVKQAQDHQLRYGLNRQRWDDIQALIAAHPADSAAVLFEEIGKPLKP